MISEWNSGYHICVSDQTRCQMGRYHYNNTYWNTISEWCIDNLGYVPQCDNLSGWDSYYYFSTVEDTLLFKLTWG